MFGVHERSDAVFNSPTGGLHTAGGELISTRIPGANHLLWWDGDLLREILDHEWQESAGVGYIGKWDWLPAPVSTLCPPNGRGSGWRGARRRGPGGMLC